jgi:hypothetical protein
MRPAAWFVALFVTTAVIIILLHPLFYGDPAGMQWQRTALLFFWFVAGASWRIFCGVAARTRRRADHFPRPLLLTPVSDLTGCRLI